MTSISAPKYTDQQAAAILARGFSVGLSAGAGCGKTFVLTQRFLTGLAPGNLTTNLRSMVAITFTDRAAREMRDRIRSACHHQIQQCAGEHVEHWLQILRGLDSARISTIHSFCTSVLRAQAVDAGIDPRFAVLEPALADSLLRNVTIRIVHGLLEQGDDDAQDFVFQFGLERARDIVRNLVGQRFQINFAKFADKTADEIADEWKRRWTTEFLPKLTAEYRSKESIARLLQLLRENTPTHPTMLERRANLLQMLDPNQPWDNPQAMLQSIHENARVQSAGRANTWPSPEVFEAVKNLLTDVRDAAADLVDLFVINEDDLKLAAELSVQALRLARLTAEAYQSAKQSQGLLDYDDLLLRARDLLHDREDVRERVAAGIKLLMVDEFQDTDPVQADIVRMLCGDALTMGRLFLVGDAKQSIYRFRRADPGVFDRLRAEIPAAGRLPLSVNFRSQPAILDFVNHLFSVGMASYYEPLTPFDAVQHSPTPAIEFLFATHDAEPVDGPLSARASATELRSREADWIARRCAELLADTTPRIRDENEAGNLILRPIRPGDIVVLFRALTHIQDYEAALRRYDLDYYLVGGKAFYAQQEIFDLLNLCRYLDDPSDLIGLVGILRSPFFNLSDDAIQAISLAAESASDSANAIERPTLHDGLQLSPPSFLSEEQQRRVAFARDVLAELRSLKDRLPLSKLLSLAIDRTAYDAALLTEHLGSRKVANLRKLIEMAQEFDRAELFTLKDFVERLKTSVTDETDEEFATTLPETGQVIRLMSIHQSKGLEFPVVIVADIDRKGPPRTKASVLHPDFGALVKPQEKFGQPHDNLGLKMFSQMEKEADEQETIRLFYVACTRAADYLILSAGIDPDVRKRSAWFQLVESRFDTTTGLLKMDPLLGSSAGATAGREAIPLVHPHHHPPQVQRVTVRSERLESVSRLDELLRTAEPTEIPGLARRLPRDADSIPPLSVSRLESIDADLRGIGHVPYERSAEQSEWVLDPDQATALGSLVHHVLERIDFKAASHWPQLLEDAVNYSPDELAEATVTAARQMLSRLMMSPLISELAEATKIHREVEFVLQWPATEADHQPILIRGIIDVLYETSDGWHVLDYKTNEFSVHVSDEQLLLPYELQLGVYGHAVTEWVGQAPRELSLVALRPVVRRITLAWSPERWQTLVSRIDACIAECRAR